MAERLDEFPSPRGSHRDDDPRWDEWLDGSPWLGKRGEDFDISLKSFAGRLRDAARRRGMTVRTATVADDQIAWQAQHGAASPTARTVRPNSPRQPWTVDGVQRAVDMWFRGVERTEILQALGRSSSSLTHLLTDLRKAGLAIPARGSGPRVAWLDGDPGKPPRITREHVLQIRGGRPGRRTHKTRERQRIERAQRYIDLWVQGLTVRDISGELGISPGAVSQIAVMLRDNGYPAPRRLGSTGEWADPIPDPLPPVEARHVRTSHARTLRQDDD